MGTERLLVGEKGRVMRPFDDHAIRQRSRAALDVSAWASVGVSGNNGTEKLQQRSEPPSLRQLMILIGARPGCSTKHLAEQTYGAVSRTYTERIRARLNQCVGAGLLMKDQGKRGGGWTLTELGRERLEDM